MTWIEQSGEKTFFETLSDWFKDVVNKIKDISWKFSGWIKDLFWIEKKTQKSLVDLSKEIVENQTKDDLKKLIKDMEDTTWLTEIEMKFIWRNKELSDYYKWLKDNLWESIAKKEMDIFLSEFIDKTKSDDKLTTDEENKLKSKILTSDEKNKLLQDNKLKTIIEEIINDWEKYNIKEIIAVYTEEEINTKETVLNKLSWDSWEE